MYFFLSQEKQQNTDKRNIFATLLFTAAGSNPFFEQVQTFFLNRYFNPVQLHSKCIFQRQIPMPRIPPVAQKSYLLNRKKRLYRPNAYIHSIMRSLYLKSHARYFSLENVEYENTTSKGLCTHQAGKGAYAGSKMYFSLIVHIARCLYILVHIFHFCL